MNANKKKKVSYRLIRLLMIYAGLPLVGIFYYMLSEELFNLFTRPMAISFEHLSQLIVNFLMPFQILLLILLIIYLIVQLLVYSILMEFIVLPWVKNKYGVILLSGVLCSLFPLFSWGGIKLNNIYEAGLNLCLIGFISGVFMGYILYCSYRNQLKQNQ